MSERYVVASLGSIGRRHLRNLRCLRPEAQIAVLRTSLSDLAGAALPEGATHQFTNIDQALAFEPTAAIIASPANLHLKIAGAFIKAGIPVLVEKPLANTNEGLRAFVDDALRLRVPAAVGYNLRFLPSLAEARALLLSGAVGEIFGARAEVGQYLPDWRPGTRYQASVSANQVLGGGALLELSHELDYLFWIFGVPDLVMARGGHLSHLELDVEDMVEVCMEYESPRRLINVHLDFLQRAPYRSCRFIGSEGTLIWNALSDSVDLFQASTGRWQHFTYSLEDRNQMYLDELADFLALIKGQGSRLPSVAHGYDVMAIIEAAKQSIASNQTIKVQGHDHD